MANRTTVSEVLEIMGKASAGTINVESYISTANRVVTRIFTGDITTDAETLTDIEKWYTAHLLASTVWRQTDEEKLGDGTIKYAGKWNTGLYSTSYGQTVMQLDTTGKMQNVDKRPVKIIAIKSKEWE